MVLRMDSEVLKDLSGNHNDAYLVGDIAEVNIYNFTLDDLEILKVCDYYFRKYQFKWYHHIIDTKWKQKYGWI